MLMRLAPFAVVCTIATLRAALSTATTPRGTGDDASKHKAFTVLEGKEAELHRKADKDFPTDPWSQSDAFAAFEADAARTFADGHHLSLTAVLAAIDEGMRDKRAAGALTLTGSVPPCHPRPIY
jgi:hypothetical protein